MKRSTTIANRARSLLAANLDRFQATFAGKVLKKDAVEAFARFSYLFAIMGRFPAAAAADDARAFAGASSAVGRALIRFVTELRKELTTQDDSPTRDPQGQIADAIGSVDPSYQRSAAPRIIGLPPKANLNRFPVGTPGEDLFLASVKVRIEDIALLVDFLMEMEDAGFVAVTPDQKNKDSLLVVLTSEQTLASFRHVRCCRVGRVRKIRAGGWDPAENGSGGFAADGRSAESGSADTRSVPGGAPGVRARVRYPIGLKLVGIITVLVASALSGMIFLASYFFRLDARVRIEENNHQSAQVLGLKVGDDFIGIVTKVQLLFSLMDAGLLQTDADAATNSLIIEEFFEANPEILWAGVPDLFSFANVVRLTEWGLDRSMPERIIATVPDLLSAGTLAASVTNMTPQFGRPTLGIALPYKKGDRSAAFLVIIDAAPQIAALQARGIGYSFVVNGEGELVLHPDATELTARKSLAELPIVDLLLHSQTDNGQTLYRDASGSEYLGSFRKADFASLGVVSVTPAALAFEAVDNIQRRNIYIMGAVLSLAVLFVYFYSRTITVPVGVLMDAAHRVENGDFHLDLKAKTHDELGALTASFVEMGRGLGEREKIKEAFGKFVNKEIAERAMRNELSLGGERRTAVVFFSDIRGFTSLSETMEPEEVVEFLNEYLTIMVGCVEKTGGVVDKFIGDAIMAVWGVPVSTGRDSAAAIDAALLMRTALEDFNRTRGTPRKPKIRIGCAINSGPLLAGQIGSSHRMEYTVIGDTVNFASRIEALTKPFAVDILVSDAVRREIGDAYILETMPLVTVKGKNEPQHVFAVLGRKNDAKAPKSVIELRHRLGIDDIVLDVTSVVSGEEEKYVIAEGKAV